MGSSHVNLASNTQCRLVGAMPNINFNKFPYDYGDRYRLVENSHTLYIINQSILFLITIHTVTYHSKPQSLHLSCLCLLFHITLRYILVSSYIFSLPTRNPFIISYSSIPSFKSLTAPPHLPLSSPYKCIQITHASLFILVHICTYHPHTSMLSFHSLSPSVSLLPSHFYLQNSFFGHSFICTYSFSLSVSLKSFFHTCLPTSLILLQMCFFHSSRIPHSHSPLILPFHSSSLLSTR